MRGGRDQRDKQGQRGRLVAPPATQDQPASPEQPDLQGLLGQLDPLGLRARKGLLVSLARRVLRGLAD